VTRSVGAARAAVVPVAVSAALAVLKAAAGLWTGSLSILASALDSLLDCGISSVNLLSIRKAEQPADAEHPFGHGKAESLAVLLQGLVLAASAVFLAWQGVLRLASPRELEAPGVGVAAMAGSLAVALLLARALVRRARETGSRALHADSLHYASDVWTSGGVLAAIAVQSVTGLTWLDPVLCFVVAGAVVHGVAGVLRGAVDELMDRDPRGEDRETVEAIVRELSPGILDYHRLRTRRAGPQRTVDVHVVICRERPFEEAHALVTALERAIRERLPNADVLVHADPCSSAPVECPGPHRHPPGRGSGALGAEVVYYETVEELPWGLRRSLPADAQERYLHRFNRVYARTGSSAEAAVAAARELEPQWTREGDEWVRRT
jgi:cation diffusion facilitator family transporter